MNPKVSVIVPSYNRFQMLVHVVDSILAQTIPVSEVLVIDDESLDETPEMFPRCIAERPGWRERVRFIRQSNQGQSVALNRGIAEAKGEWLGFGGHDDLWLPWKLEWQFRALREAGSSCGFCFTDAWFMNNPHMKQTVFQFSGCGLAGSPTGEIPDPVDVVTARHPVWVQTVIAEKELVKRAGGFDPYLRYSEDHDFTFRMSLITRFCYVNMPLVLIDRSPADIRHTGSSLDWHKVEYCLRMDQYRYEKQLAFGKDLPARVQRRIRRNLRSVHSHWANLFLEMRKFQEARNAARMALQQDASVRITIKWLLTAATPRLARAIFVARDRSGNTRYDRTSWKDSSPSVK